MSDVTEKVKQELSDTGAKLHWLLEMPPMHLNKAANPTSPNYHVSDLGPSIRRRHTSLPGNHRHLAKESKESTEQLF